MLVQVAMIAVAMFGILSIAIDMGLVTLTRVQMQNAADAAAVEGMRYRDLDPDGFWSDCQRRNAAYAAAQRMFDTADPTLSVTGSIANFEGGDGTPLNAYQQIDPPSAASWYTRLKLNQSTNAVDGDMVSGQFLAAGGSAEDEHYARGDFNPLAPVAPDGMQTCNDSAPTGHSIIPDQNDAFLFRLRRTRETFDVNSDSSSGGPPLPLLFARGTAIHAKDDTYNPRTNGFTVRATAIAATRNALRIGGLCLDPMQVPCNMRNPQLEPEYGAVSFALKKECWDPNAPVTGAQVLMDGTITTDGCAAEAGHFVQPGKAWQIGGVIDETVFQAPAAGSFAECGFVAIYQTIDVPRVIGFGRIAAAAASAGDPSVPDCQAPATIPGPVVIQRRVSHVALRNASAFVDFAAFRGMDPSVVTALLAANSTLSQPLLAPALVR